MSERYTIISADSHAGGNMAAYEEYLPAEWRAAYDEWRGGYKNPYRDLQDDGRTRNWDNERRVSEQYADGVVAEITFPNTVPPFYPTGALLARSPKDSEDFRRRKAGLECHNRWLADWCGEYPDQRRGLPQIFLEDLDDAIKTLTWAANEGFKSFLMPHVAPDVDLPGLWSPEWDRLWAAVQDLDLVVTQHGGNGTPDYGKDPASGVIFLMEVPFFAHRNLAQKKGGAKKALTDIVGEQSEVVLSSSGEESASGRVQVCPCSCDVSLLRGRGEERCRSEPLTPQIECPLYLSCEELM